MMMCSEELTICAVSYRSADLLRLNIALTAALNPGFKPNWIIVDNNDDFNGVAPADCLLLKGDPCLNMGKLRGSYHHAQSLNKAIRFVETRYMLVLDPDFFILQEQWISDVLEHINKHDVVLWGAPYAPHANWKRRYVPAAYCMLIDLQKCSKEKLDFTPELDEYHTIKVFSWFELFCTRMGFASKELEHVEQSVRKDIAGVVMRNRFLLEPLSRFFPKRFYANTNIARDTGFKIQKKFSGNRRDVETLQPSYVNDLFTRKQGVIINLFARLYALLVPETFSIYPKRNNYTTTLRFVDFHLPDIHGLFGWEEYFWKGVPFALHLKGGTAKFEEIGKNTLAKILFDLTTKPGIMDAVQDTI